MSFRAKREISPHCRTRDFSQESKWQRRGLNDRGKNLDSRLLLSRMTEKINRPRLNKPFSRIQNIEMSLLCRLRARRSRSTESTFWRRLFERSEFLSHLRVRARTTSPVWMSIHPVWRRCSSFPYEEYAQSSRLAKQASHHPNRGSCSCANPDSVRRRRHPGEPASEQGRRDRERAKMVLGTFAETKGTRRAGTTPRY